MKINNINNFRINLLDSFRGIAILLVLFFHFFSRYTILYPYHDKCDFFSYGKMGVHFFFIISGFVILYTLENTNDFVTFWKKRMIRLLPSMLVASILTYLIFNLFDSGFLFPTSHFFKNILASITFIPPDLLASVFNLKVELDYISGSYWSLWPEIQFYLFISSIYFFCKNKFLILFFSLSFIGMLINFIISNVLIKDNNFIKAVKSYLIVFNLIPTLPYFCFGVIFYLMYKNKILNKEVPFYVKIFSVLLLILQIFNYYTVPLKLALFFLFFTLFVILIVNPKVLNFLENKILQRIGVSSYFLYLIHENIGVLIINKYGVFFTNYEFIFPLGLILFFAVISVFYTYNIEKLMNNYLKKVFLKKRNSISEKNVN